MQRPQNEAAQRTNVGIQPRCQRHRVDASLQCEPRAASVCFNLHMMSSITVRHELSLYCRFPRIFFSLQAVGSPSHAVYTTSSNMETDGHRHHRCHGNSTVVTSRSL
ncbi:hypothetical protein CPLU01_08225 [Colletotrichum plurivorum]|uniref:Uncharacterized protein n=1 Tax=Colletotrichum plurivorum TaxID=2175906 RepID=A0A8H6KCF4_9PEZI|nr:hypothetical protein CPLU01_08225 [Colletotrichum plurivorum]